MKNILFPLLGIDLLLYPIHYELYVGYGPFFINRIPISNFAYNATAKPRVSRKYRHKSIYITTQLTTFYYYNASSSITNLSNV